MQMRQCVVIQRCLSDDRREAGPGRGVDGLPPRLCVRKTFFPSVENVLFVMVSSGTVSSLLVFLLSASDW